MDEKGWPWGHTPGWPASPLPGVACPPATYQVGFMRNHGKSSNLTETNSQTSLV